MPHNAGQYVQAKILSQGSTHSINHIEAATLEHILQNDAKDYFYSATVSIASALSSITKEFYSWSTVQFYYADFYLLRGLLALAGICIFYEGTKPRTLLAMPSQTISVPSGGKKNSTTHGLVLHLAKSHFGHAITRSQIIDSQDPLDWVKARREEANYNHSRFPEPKVPTHLEMCKKNGVRKSISNYLEDKKFTYTNGHNF